MAGTPELEILFPNFDAALAAHLKKIGNIIHFEEGDLLMRTGQYFKNTLLILEGRVKLYREGDEGEEFFLYHLEPGNACALSMICATRNELSEVKAKAISKVVAL